MRGFRKQTREQRIETWVARALQNKIKACSKDKEEGFNHMLKELFPGMGFINEQERASGYEDVIEQDHTKPFGKYYVICRGIKHAQILYLYDGEIGDAMTNRASKHIYTFNGVNGIALHMLSYFEEDILEAENV